MDIITQSNFDDFKENFDVTNQKEETAFENFVNYCIISKHQRAETITKSSLEAIHIGGGNDTGIDGFILIVNGKQVCSKQEILDLLKANGYLDVKFIFVQTKTSSKFDTAEIGTFTDGVKLVFRRMHDDISLPSINGDVAFCNELVQFIYKNASKFMSSRKPKLYMYYVTTGKYDKTNQDIIAKFDNVVADLNSYNLLSADIEWQAVGANELMDYYAATKQHDEVVIKVAQTLALPDIDKVDQGYLFLLPFSEYRKLIIDETTDTIKTVFNDNIRAYQGDNPVNKEMGNTVDKKEFALFTAMNNGITIIAKQIMVAGTRITLTDYQIVNGCQTSHVLYQKRNVEGIDNLYLLVKLIASTDRDVRNNIIFGANSQTAVMREQLIALSELQERIESYYNAVRKTDRLYYERRSKQYHGDSSVPAYKVVTIPMLIKSVVSMFLGEPHNVNGYYGCIVEKLQQGTKKIFSEDYQLDIYYTCGYAHYQMIRLFDMGILPRQYKKVKFHLLLAFRLVCDHEFGAMPELNSRKMPAYCEKVNDALYNLEKCKRMFLNAVALLKRALGRDKILPNDCQSEKLSNYLRKVFFTGNTPSTAVPQQTTLPQLKIVGKIDLDKIPDTKKKKRK